MGEWRNKNGVDGFRETEAPEKRNAKGQTRLRLQMDRDKDTHAREKTNANPSAEFRRL